MTGETSEMEPNAKLSFKKKYIIFLLLFVFILSSLIGSIYLAKQYKRRKLVTAVNDIFLKISNNPLPINLSQELIQARGEVLGSIMLAPIAGKKYQDLSRQNYDKLQQLNFNELNQIMQKINELTSSTDKGDWSFLQSYKINNKTIFDLKNNFDKISAILDNIVINIATLNANWTLIRNLEENALHLSIYLSPGEDQYYYDKINERFFGTVNVAPGAYDAHKLRNNKIYILVENKKYIDQLKYNAKIDGFFVPLDAANLPGADGKQGYQSFDPSSLLDRSDDLVGEKNQSGGYSGNKICSQVSEVLSIWASMGGQVPHPKAATGSELVVARGALAQAGWGDQKFTVVNNYPKDHLKLVAGTPLEPNSSLGVLDGYSFCIVDQNGQLVKKLSINKNSLLILLPGDFLFSDLVESKFYNSDKNYETWHHHISIEANTLD